MVRPLFSKLSVALTQEEACGCAGVWRWAGQEQWQQREVEAELAECLETEEGREEGWRG